METLKSTAAVDVPAEYRVTVQGSPQFRFTVGPDPPLEESEFAVRFAVGLPPDVDTTTLQFVLHNTEPSVDMRASPGGTYVEVPSFGTNTFARGPHPVQVAAAGRDGAVTASTELTLTGHGR